MTNIASALKSEISRLARKELRTKTEATKKAIAGYRHQIAEMKRRIQALEKGMAKLHRGTAMTPVAAAPESGANLRFRAAGFAKHRQRLGLSAKDMGLLLNASSLSVYKWEHGQARPRAKHLEAIAALRKMGKREARERLDQLGAG
jgi:DNA-binding transcriptional regulator YiaG